MDAQEANRLVARYSNMILRISYQYLKQTWDAEDICQTVLLKYLTKAPAFESEEYEKAWIIRTTINACKDQLKSAFFRRTVALEEADHIAAPTVPDSPVLDALADLPRDQRVALYLYYYEEYAARDIGQILGKSEASVNQLLSRGRRKLRTTLSAERGL